MTLDEYMADTGIGPSFISKKLGITTPTLWNWRNGKRKIPKTAIIVIETLTNGKVTEKDWENESTLPKSDK